MKKSFGLYAMAWAAALALFNAIVFVTPSEIDGVSKFTNTFWGCYAIITLVFISNLICAYMIFKGEKLQSTFYNLSIYQINVTSLIAILIVGGICMAVPSIPEWLGAIVCCVVLVFNVVSVAKAAVAVDVIEGIDKKIKTKTLFIKMLTADAEVLMQSASTPELKAVTKTVYEAVRYSDPMSDNALAAVEERITNQFYSFSHAVNNGMVDVANAEAQRIQYLINERNAKCKILK